MAAQWIHEFVKLSGNVMLPYMPGILMAQLPNLVFDVASVFSKSSVE